MSASTEPPPEWREFLATLAPILPESAAPLASETRLIEDLGLDSLALAELLVLLMEQYDPPGLADPLVERNWQGATLGMLFQECSGLAVRAQPHRRSSRTA